MKSLTLALIMYEAQKRRAKGRSWSDASACTDEEAESERNDHSIQGGEGSYSYSLLLDS